MKDGSLVDAIAAAFRSDELIEVVPILPSTLEGAYRVQALAAKRTGARGCGYKIGATNAAAQAKLGSNGPLYGPIFEQGLISSSGRYQLSPNALGAECEIAFVMARDVVGAAEGLSRESLSAAVASCHPAIEVAHRRLDPRMNGQIGVTCDFCFTGNVALGEPVDDWASLDLAQLSVVARLNHAEVARGSGADALGHPLDALIWLARTLQAHGTCLKRDEVVITGSCTGITPLRPGDHFSMNTDWMPTLAIDVEG